MTTTEEILRRVAAGELSPDDALPLLDSAGFEAGSTTTPAPETVTEPGPASSDDDAPPWGSTTPYPGSGATPSGPSVPTTVTAVRVHASYRSVDVVADPSVAQVAVSGNHTVRLENAVMVVESQDSPFSGFTGSGKPGAKGQPTFTFADLPRSLAYAKSWMDQRLMVRINPELAVELDSAGASITLRGVSGGARVRVIASALKLDRVRGALDIDAMSSSVKGIAVLTGPSRISCESSSVKLLLGEGSDVHIRARNRMGKVVLPNAVSTGGLVDPDVSEATLGAGRHELSVDAVMSSVFLTDDTGGGME